MTTSTKLSQPLKNGPKEREGHSLWSLYVFFAILSFFDSPRFQEEEEVDYATVNGEDGEKDNDNIEPVGIYLPLHPYVLTLRAANYSCRAC